MSEKDDFDWAFPGQEPEDPADIALHAIAYRSPEVALETYSMLEAAGLILESMRTGVPYDQDRMDRLRAAFARDEEPQHSVYFDEDGYEVTEDDEGHVISRVESSPATMRYFRELKEQKLAIKAYVDDVTPKYVDHILGQLADPETAQGELSILIERGRKEGEIVSQNELVQAAIGEARRMLIDQGYVAKEQNKSVGADGSPDHPKSERTHTLRTLVVTRLPEPAAEL